MYSKTLHGIEDDYNDFIASCPDTSLTNEVKRVYNKLLPFEYGKNIKETGLIITDSLHLVKGSESEIYPVICIHPDGLGGMSLQTAPTWKNNSKQKGWPYRPIRTLRTF